MVNFTKERVELFVKKTKVIGNLFIPKNSDSHKHPTAMIIGPMTSVKEQVTGVYAEALAKKGFVTLAIDHRYFGESDGEPRQYEKFPDKVEDIKYSLEYIKKRPEVNPDQVSLVGVCLGAGYALATAAETAGIYKIVAIAGYYRHTLQMKKNNLNDFNNKISLGVKARETYEFNKQILTIPAASTTEEAAMQTKDTVDYYTRRAAVKNYKNSFAIMSREYFMEFDVQSYASKIKNPFMMIHSPNALSPAWAEEFYNNVKSKKNSHLIYSDGQTDFYDDTKIIDYCIQKIKEHLLTD